MRPDISVVIPARNESGRIAPTIQSIARARTTGARVEFVVVDDASTDGCIADLISAVPELLEEPDIDIRVYPLGERSGVYRARNAGASAAAADILFMTDAHVRFSAGWDEIVFHHIQPDRLVAGVTTEDGSPFRGYGCQLLVPFMGTCWNDQPIQGVGPIQIAACHATALTRELFCRLGGYDSGMIQYGAGEPEFSLRAWLHGAEIAGVEGLEVEHYFKPDEENARHLDAVRPYSVHNRIRFGLLYLSEAGCLQLLRYYSRAYPTIFPRAIKMIDRSDVWERRELLEEQRERSFDWFVRYFGLRNQIGGEII